LTLLFLPKASFYNFVIIYIPQVTEFPERKLFE
jgi:hypothetical protein